MKARHARTIRAGIAEGRTLWGTPFSDNPYVMLEKPNLFQRAVLSEHQNDPHFHIWPQYVREWLADKYGTMQPKTSESDAPDQD